MMFRNKNDDWKLEARNERRRQLRFRLTPLVLFSADAKVLTHRHQVPMNQLCGQLYSHQQHEQQLLQQTRLTVSRSSYYTERTSVDISPRQRRKRYKAEEALNVEERQERKSNIGAFG